MTKRKVVTLSGSIRRGSHNTKLATMMAEKVRALGGDVTEISLGDYPMPLFNADDEAKNGAPAAAVALSELFAEADAIFIASPEYNGSITPLLKNTLDWISRQKNSPYKRATFGLGAASPGKLSGVMGLAHTQDILGKLGALIAPTTLAVGFASQAFNTDGMLKDEVAANRADQLADQLMTISRAS